MKNFKFRQALFWDANPQKIDAKKNAQYIVERIVDFGNDKEARWALGYYSKDFLRRIILKSRCLRSDSKKLWLLLLERR